MTVNFVGETNPYATFGANPLTGASVKLGNIIKNYHCYVVLLLIFFGYFFLSLSLFHVFFFAVVLIYGE